MSTQTAATRGTDRDVHVGASTPRTDRRVSTETKSAFKTTEMIAYVVTVIGVLIAAAVVDNADAGGLGAKQAWLYVTILTVGYMISRGLAKAGSRDFYDDQRWTPTPSGLLPASSPRRARPWMSLVHPSRQER